MTVPDPPANVTPPDFKAWADAVTDDTNAKETPAGAQAKADAALDAANAYTDTAVDNATSDTGWVDISASLTNGWTGSIELRRIGDDVTISGTLNGSAKTNDIFVNLPTGYRPDRSVNVAVPVGSTSVARVLVGTTGNCAGLSSSAGYLVHATWPSGDDFPS